MLINFIIIKMENQSVVWVSVDPIRRKVDFYPKSIAQRLEKHLKDNNENIYNDNKISSCYLGTDFFNATVHLRNNGFYYQTTPGISFGRAGYKQPGYRSVRRFIVNEDKKLEIYGKYIYGELRICNLIHESSIRFNEDIPEECIIKTDFTNELVEISTWVPENLRPDVSELETNVVIWQWCNANVDIDNIMQLNENTWIPYLYEQNEAIEHAFKNKQKDVEIKMLHESTVKIIEFINTSSFAKQINKITNGERLVRRKIVTIQELNKLITYYNKNFINLIDISTLLQNEEIPIEFICCISQDIMTDPVKTSDGFIYDRKSIEKWFENSNKSPLTGLELNNKTLTTNNELKSIITKYIEEKIN